MPASLLDRAYEVVSASKEPVSFNDIWKYVSEKEGMSAEEAAKRVSRFYTNLMLDGRFVTLGENMWDLRVRHTFDKVHIDMKDVYSEVEVSDDDEEDAEEEKEYNSALEEGKEEDDSESSSEEEENE